MTPLITELHCIQTSILSPISVIYLTAISRGSSLVLKIADDMIIDSEYNPFSNSNANIIQFSLTSMKECNIFTIFLIFLPLIVSLPVIDQLGLILHHNDNSKFGDLTAYVANLNKPTCKLIAEFNVISTVPQSLQISNLQKQASNLAIPLHFHFIDPLTPNFRFLILKESRAELYYIGNIQTNDTCENLGNHLTFAQEHMAAGVIPLIGEFDQTSVVTVDNSQKIISRYFGYGQSPKLNHYQIVQNIRFISRHTLQIAQSSIPEVLLMAKGLPVACEEIYLNFVAAHFYPELRSRIDKFTSMLPPVDYWRTSAIKTTCIRQFIDVLGYCPLYYQKKVFNRKIWINPHFEQVVQLKKVALNSQFLALQPQQRLLYPSSIEIAQTTSFLDNLSQTQQIILATLSSVMLLLLALASFLSFKISPMRRTQMATANIN